MSGSASVFINGRPAGRIGDAIDCGGNAATGSSNVFIGDEGPGGSGCQTQQGGNASPSTRG
ncbi:PAAR domain-containing protein [Rhizobium sp. FKY42]|uniref:PAAR domain-containing protein n=1 Tax=Rhizobium sp. FKY42 TaxID=2562310 RepID=UPI001FEF65BE|nr:PAAR domain-containing protein [Rhizobium sp. FKY42]